MGKRPNQGHGPDYHSDLLDASAEQGLQLLGILRLQPKRQRGAGHGSRQAPLSLSRNTQ